MPYITKRPRALDSVPEVEWTAASVRARVLAPLAQLTDCSIEDMDEAAAQLQVSRATAYRLLARYKQNLETTSLLPETRGWKPGTSKLNEIQETIIHEAIHRFFLSRQRPSVAALHRSIELECFQAKVPKPTYKTVRARVKAVKPRDFLRSRHGNKAAADKFNPVFGSLRAEHPLDLVQIDHTPVDVIVVDEWERKPIGRPWLTLAVDVATRTVPGFYLSLRAPSALSVAMVLNQAVLGKERYLAALDVDVDWPVCGLPKVLHLDNAREFHSRALMRGCQQHGIEVVHRPPLRPHYGGHIERLIGTLMGEVHLLPGTTFSSVAERGDYDSGKTAVMTIHELETWLAWQIPGVYHARNHAALGCSPLQAWNERLRRMPVPPRDPVDPYRFYL